MKNMIRQVIALVLCASMICPQIAFAQTAPVSGVVNISNRIKTTPDNPSFIVGFVVAGTTPKRVIIRAVGPGLTDFGVIDANPDPRVELFASNGSPLGGNDDWMVGYSDPEVRDLISTSAQVGAFPLKQNSWDAVVIRNFPPGSYTARVGGSRPERGDYGQILLEIYIVP